MQSLRKTGYSSYYGASCCEACQVLSFSTPLDKISWKGKQCWCVGTGLDTCSSDQLESRSGWGSADCTQWQPGGRKRRQLDMEEEKEEEEAEHYSREVLERFDNLDILAAAERKRGVPVRRRRSVDTITEREVTCESLWDGSVLYWKYEYEIPSFCHSESTCPFCSFSNTFFSRDKLYQG